MFFINLFHDYVTLSKVRKKTLKNRETNNEVQIDNKSTAIIDDVRHKSIIFLYLEGNYIEVKIIFIFLVRNLMNIIKKKFIFAITSHFHILPFFCHNFYNLTI